VEGAAAVTAGSQDLAPPLICVALVRRCLWFGSIYLLSVGLLGAAGQEITGPIRGEQFVGAAGCKSSSCHGGAGEKRNQFMTWTQQDFHARAYAVLLNARSTRMAETLRLGQAQASPRCTVCHSPFQAVEPAALTSSARVDEGVSCENCHNAAGGWLRRHTRRDFTYPMRVTAGMRDLRNFYVRANTCVACHQNLDADVAAAGHPELRFELDGQSVAEPKHWRDPDGTGPKGWLVGQAVALREMSWALANTANPSRELRDRWNALAWLLGTVTGQQSQLPLVGLPEPTSSRPSLFADVQGRADSLARSAAQLSLGDEFARQTLKALSHVDSEFLQSKESRGLLFRRAERLVPALHRLAVAVGTDSDASPMPEYQTLMESLQPGDLFDVQRFTNALAAYREKVTSSSMRR
jgi:Cytochrome c554 and c-prime